MADTTNYGWTKPTVSGSSGAWGTLLNTALDDIDTDLKAVSDAAAAAQADATATAAELVAWPLIHGITGIDLVGDESGMVKNTAFNGGLKMGTGQSLASYIFPLTGLRVGQRITGFKSKAQAPTGTTVAVTLQVVTDSDGVFATSSHTHGTSLAVVETTGIGYDVDPARSYIIVVTMQRTSGTNQPSLLWVQPIVTHP